MTQAALDFATVGGTGAWVFGKFLVVGILVGGTGSVCDKNGAIAGSLSQIGKAVVTN